MRILIVTQYFTPEVTAASARLQAFADGLAGCGHAVEVICEIPNHPEGIVRPEFAGRRLVRREQGGIQVKHVWVRPAARKTTVNRLVFYASFAAAAAAAGIAGPRPDVVFASSPPLPGVAAAPLIAARHRVPWMMDVRDLWPEAAVLLGELTDPRAIRAAESLERRLYASAAAISVTTDAFRADIAVRIEDPDKLMLLPNGAGPMWFEAAAWEPDRKGLGLPDDVFLWTYAGNLGIAQGLEAAVEAARLLGEGFHLSLIGGGPRRESLERQAAELPPGLVSMREPVEPELAARHLRASDAVLVSLGADPGLSRFVPSKLFDCWALGRPVVLAAQGEAPRLAAQSQAALTVAPGDPQAIAGAVRALRDDPGERERLAAAGRETAARYRREDQALRLEERLAELVAGRRA